jgi:hypothetical protein
VSTATVTIRTTSVADNTKFAEAAITVTAGFTISTDRTDPVGSGTITVRGEHPSGTNERRVQAFDNNPATKWLDFSAQSWIQFQFDGTAKYTINKYTITSANDAPARDPSDWKL